MADRVAIWIEKADVGNRHGVQTALSAGFANQAVDLKDARLVVVFRLEQRRL